MKPKVILILGKIPPPYMGPSIATQILLNSSLKNNFELIHVDTKVNADLNDIGKWSFAKIKNYYRIWKGMIDKIKIHHPDLILIPISQSTIGFLKDSVFIIIAKFYRKKTLLHLRGSDFRRWLFASGKLNQWYVRRCLKMTKGIIVLGNNLKPLFKDLYKDEQIFVASNGGDYIIPQRTNQNNKIRILYIGNLQSSKGIEDVINACILLKKNHTGEFELHVIGGWRKEETKQKCLELIAGNELPVQFTPPEMSKNKLQELSNADIFVFPPREPEGHPWVIVEAMAAGLPVISTNQGAITESVINKKNGFIVPSADPGSIAEKLAELINNPALRQRMASESRKRYEQYFTEKVMVENLSRIFNTVIDRK